jgi:hypothetical protein
MPGVSRRSFLETRQPQPLEFTADKRAAYIDAVSAKQCPVQVVFGGRDTMLQWGRYGVTA